MNNRFQPVGETTVRTINWLKQLAIIVQQRLVQCFITQFGPTTQHNGSAQTTQHSGSARGQLLAATLKDLTDYGWYHHMHRHTGSDSPFCELSLCLAASIQPAAPSHEPAARGPSTDRPIRPLAPEGPADKGSGQLFTVQFLSPCRQGFRPCKRCAQQHSCLDRGCDADRVFMGQTTAQNGQKAEAALRHSLLLSPAMRSTRTIAALQTRNQELACVYHLSNPPC